MNPAQNSLRFVGLLLLLAAAACRRDMFDQPRADPLGESHFFADGAASRPVPPHTVARGQSQDDAALHTGRIGTNPAVAFPFPVTRPVLERGRQRHDIYCAPCHGRAGRGDGAIVQRGYPAPPSYHEERLRQAPAGHLVDVMTRGYGVMYPYADKLKPADRWAVAAYIRALQLSQRAPIQALSAAERAELEDSP